MPLIKPSIKPTAKKSWLGRMADSVTQGITHLAAAQLTPVPPPKVGNKQVSFPSYLKSIAATTAALTRLDLNVANVDITQTYRFGARTPDILRNLARATPDLSAAIAANLRVGIPEKFTLRARDPDGTLNREATLLAMQIANRMDFMPDYLNGFSQVASLRSVSEALGKEIMLEGACAMELVLDKARMPLKFQPISVSQIIFFPDGDGLKPVQRLGGVDTDLDIPTFFYTALDVDLKDAYPQSPFEAAIQPILASSTFLNDLRKVCARHVHPRYDISINEEKLRARIPQDVLADEALLSAYLNNLMTEVEQAVNGLGVEDAIIHFDFFEVKYVEGGKQDVPNTFEAVQGIYDSKVSTGARTMPSILGHGSGSQNVASSETLVWMLSANGMIRIKLNEMYSKGFTLAVRLFGLDVTVEFAFDDIELRPASETEAFKSMKQARILEMLSHGFLTDDDAALSLTGQLTPNGFKPLSGTGFYSGSVAGPGDTNPLGNQQGALQQSNKPTSPTQPKGKPKAEVISINGE